VLVESDRSQYEDQLPAVSDDEYDRWFDASAVIDGVRMGPRMHEHGWRWTAWLCCRWQLIRRWMARC